VERGSQRNESTLQVVAIESVVVENAAMDGSGGTLVGGRWVEGRSGTALVVTEPATGRTLAELGEASPADVDDAVAGAVDAADQLEALTAFERAELLHRTADLLDERRDELAEQLSRESGKPLVAEAVDELVESAEIFRLAAEEVKRLETQVLPSADPAKRVFTFRKPNGVYALITPWNFPMNIPAELLAAALAAGNPAILKPSEETPLSAVALARAACDAGFPAGSVSVLHGGRPIGEALVTHAAVDGIGFVGSHEAGEAIVRSAGLKRTLIEASGNGPQIVCDDADLDAAAAAAVFGAHYASGQCCVATERLLVQVSVHDELVERLLAHAGEVVLGDPLDPATTLGPLNNEAVAAKMDRHLADGVDRGAELLAGGRRAPGRPTDLYYEMTVVDGVGTDALLFTDESFGPVVPITTFESDDEAIALANRSTLGLQAAVFTSSLARAYRYIEQVRAGTIVVNDTTSFWETHPPFGGASRTRSGWGRIGGRFTLLDMTDIRTAIIDVANTRDGWSGRSGAGPAR
jgi:acyl-CoA reductase-like NAD-dependent aldehyde dehydrogenase